MIRTKDEVISDLKKLIYKRGYIYSLCMILFEDFHLDLNKIHEVDHRSRLSVKECSLILGFLVQKEIDFSTPESPLEAFELKERTYELMQELHLAINAPQFEKFKEMFERQERGETFEDSFEHRLDFFVKDGGMVEPMFYAGDGIYDFQYMEYLDKKYKYDKDWLLENRNFDLEKVQLIVSTVKEFFKEKAEIVSPINVKDVFPEIAAKARKRAKKKKLSKKEQEEAEREMFISASYYRYVRLFPDPLENEGNSEKGWEEFYQNLLDLFIIQPSDIKDVDEDSIQSFFENFSFSIPANQGYDGPGAFNLLNSCPMIKLNQERYLLPIGYLLPEAVYESPFYWMWDDKSYRNSLAEHRGDVGEEISYEHLSKVFGEKNTFKSVLVETKKGNPDTDIDVLCIVGNKALCVQVKSKKLTLAAKRGDFDQLSKDFKGAVQDAYDQGIVSRDTILSGKPRFYDEHKNELSLPENIDEVYIMGLTTENYPSLAHQVHIMLEKKEDDPYPLFVSVFDLELLAYYLSDPFEFLYYVRQRTDLMDYFKADEELVYLGYHLDQKLWPREGYDFAGIEPDFGGIIDRNYYPYKLGVSHLLPEEDDPISKRWTNPDYEALLTEIKSTNHPNVTDIVFHLLDWSSEARTNIISQLSKLKSASKLERKVKSFATLPAASFGLSFVVLDHFDPKDLEARTAVYAELRKYVSKCDSWLGIGTFANSSNLVDVLIYIDDPWEHDPMLESRFSDEIARMRSAKVTPFGRKKKIQRNDPCPCKSGLKYKRCCGKNQ